MILPHILIDIFCTIQRSMLGNVTPNLRAVYVVFENKHSFELNFYYDKPFSEDEKEFASLVDTDILSDFPSPVYKTGFNTMSISWPNKIPDNGYCIYRRFEKNYNPLD
jgi:hypothetical protein